MPTIKAVILLGEKSLLLLREDMESVKQTGCCVLLGLLKPLAIQGNLLASDV
jgi:hypothetical protein